jgi:ABC-type multidrug transport system ATPase subunit
MLFTVLTMDEALPRAVVPSTAYLIPDNWDDWFKFRTTFGLLVIGADGQSHHIGQVKIGQIGLLEGRAGADLAPDTRYPRLPRTFTALDANKFFSLGQTEDYYVLIRKIFLGGSAGFLRSLCDCAYDLTLFEKNQNEPVMGESLLRGIRSENVRHRLHRLAHGTEALTRFEFQYTFPAPPVEGASQLLAPPPTLQFLVEPGSYPPSNVHVLIGRNGAGKTRCIQSLVNAVIERPSEKAPPGVLERTGNSLDEWNFSGLVCVSFSAFDESQPLPPKAALKTRADLVGLRKFVETPDGRTFETLKSKDDLAADFLASFKICASEPKRSRWLTAIASLSADPLFEEIEVERLLEISEMNLDGSIPHVFKKLSSGHAIVLLTVTRLVELVEASTLVVLDEPEGHLHPPLLSAFIRALSDLLVSQNGVALVATHSPVVLQEVPRQCVWILSRARTQAIAERPPCETFGESAGILTREVFSHEVTKTGFHRLIEDAAQQPGATYESVVAKFDGKLGTEAKVLARGLLALGARDGVQ